MKFFEMPEVEIEKFHICDVITTSGGDDDEPVLPGLPDGDLTPGA